MEITITEKPPSICLNMIVKNEAHIIQETLTKLCDKIKFSYWVICDTGSTDDTPKIIEDFFKSREILGEMFYDDWKNFAYNRTLALNRAHKKTDLLLVFDADDEIVGEINMPSQVNADEYHLQFGSSMGPSYTRVLLINNQKPFEYKSVVHEFITCKEPGSRSALVEGTYYVVSGRSSARNRDSEKYLKDAKLLELAYYEAVTTNDDLFHRYAFYCGNSYKDFGSYEEAIKWYKIVLSHPNQWVQEKYMACLSCYECFNALNKKEEGFFFLVHAFACDNERMECLYHLVNYYCVTGANETAYAYYLLCKDFYENRYLTSNIQTKLFVQNEKYDFLLPYYMILVCDKVKNVNPDANKTIAKMYEIIFTKKTPHDDEFLLGNLLYNLQFFIELGIKHIPNFIVLFQSYICFLESRNKNLAKHDFLKTFEKHGVVFQHNKIVNTRFSQEECKQSNKILIYAGFCDRPWNYTYSLSNALGGSESAICRLARSFPKNCEIYIAGHVEEEVVDNMHFINFNSLPIVTREFPFHTIILSRYIAFYEMFPETSFYQSLIWGHDVLLFNYGCNLDVHNILDKWSNKINGCICQTEWHKNLFLELYPQLSNKCYVINNGIEVEKFIYPPKKIENRFMYSSCSERGLDRLLELWGEITNELSNTELYICSYNDFPRNDYEIGLQKTISNYKNIKHVGKLNRDELYRLMSTCEYWLYPTSFSETSCITSMEMLMSEVICIYYPLAGLINTLGDYGIPISRGQEVETILNLTTKRKNDIRKRGKEYTSSCSWENRYKMWSEIIFANQQCEGSKLVEIKDPEKNIKVVNMKKREDRKNAMISQFEREKVTNYDFVEAINGEDLPESDELRLLFEGNNFGYKKGVIGCALSHLKIWNDLVQDENNEYYVVLEDDVELLEGFKEKLDEITKKFVEEKIEHLALALSLSNNDQEFSGIAKAHDKGNGEQIYFFQKDVFRLWNITFAYIISKNAARKIVSYVNNCSMKCACDNPQAYGHVINYHCVNNFIVRHPTIIESSDSDIMNNSKYFSFASSEKTSLRISYCDWWYDEYCGGVFNFYDNFITDVLKKYGSVNELLIVQPNENPDILFYSIFGSEHTKYPGSRRVFFSGEPFGIRNEADFNLTFDRNSEKNTRFPLWMCYLNDYLLDECTRRKNGIINVPKRERFCSFISAGEVKTTHRRTIVEKLSTYKKVHCGGGYLNNIGYSVPRGENCSGKIEHNNNYKFAIAFENEDYPGYVTEKICDIYKSNCVPIYWGTKEVVRDFNPNTFINANDFDDFDKLVEYIIKVDNDDELYASYFTQPIFTNKWIDAFNDPNKSFYKNLADSIIGKRSRLVDNYFNTGTKIKVFNIWHNKLFDHCYEKLDSYSLSKLTMFDVNPKYQKIYNSEKNYNIAKEYELSHYNPLFQDTNYCQTSCLYHVFKNEMYLNQDYVGFIQYDMELADDFIYDMEEKIKKSKNDIYFYSQLVSNKVDVPLICTPYDNSVLEKYNQYFKTNHTYESIKSHKNADKFICLHTFVIPKRTYEAMMNWFCSITDWLHVNYINGIYCESMSEVTEEIFGLFLLLQMIENDSIQLEELKLHHDWPKLHNENNFDNYKQKLPHFTLDQIDNINFTDKNECYSYLDVYEKLMSEKQLSCKNILEIGIQRGGSMKLWNDYFVNANIYGFDVDDAPEFLKDLARVKCFKMDAYSDESINYFLQNGIKLDFAIDDGPHTFESMVYFIKNYIQLLTSDGMLIVEDVQDITWCDKFKSLVPDGFTYEIFDLRQNKNRWDDILFVVKRDLPFTEKIGESPKENSNKKSIFDISGTFKIEYGTDATKIDVTDKMLQKKENDVIKIPTGDNERAEIFGDPVHGILKSVFVSDKKITRILESKDYAYMNVKTHKLYINRPIVDSKYNLCIMSIFKNETINLKVWLEHYLWQGVEHFYLIDNGSTDNPLEILQDYIDHGLITYYYRAEKYQQPQHYRYVFDNEKLNEKTEWLCICDLDEFFFGTGKILANELDNFDEYDIIYTNSYFYGSDHLIEHPKDIRTGIVHRQSDLENGIKYIFRPQIVCDSSEIWIHWLVHSGSLQKKIMERETFENKKIRLNHYPIQSKDYFMNIKMKRGDVSVPENENIRTIEYFEMYEKISDIRDETLSKIVVNGYNNSKNNTALIVEPRFLKNLPFVINDFHKKLGDGWKIVFYCGVGLKNIWLDLLKNYEIEIRELKENCYAYNEYCDFVKSKELWESLYGDYVLVFTSNSIIINESPFTIDNFISLNKSYIGGNQFYQWKELTRENIYPEHKNFHGGLSLRKRTDMIKIIETFGVNKTCIVAEESMNITMDMEDVYFTIGCYKLGLPVGDDDLCSHFSVHTILKGKFFGANRVESGYYLSMIQKYDNVCDNPYVYKSITDIDNETIVVHPSTGFFSNCTLRLFDIILYFNSVKKLPMFVDSSKQFELFKFGTNLSDVTNEYFCNTIEDEIYYENAIDFREQYQYTDYKTLKFEALEPFIKKYFTPSEQVKSDIKFIETKYEVNEYNNLCALFYRGNDKATEIALPEYDDILEKARELYRENNNIKFLVQSDEIEFIERVLQEFPNNAFYFKDEVRTINKNSSLSVDGVTPELNFAFTQYYLAITLIMSKCKYLVCGSGNGSLWIVLYRGNSENVFQIK